MAEGGTDANIDALAGAIAGAIYRQSRSLSNVNGSSSATTPTAGTSAATRPTPTSPTVFDRASELRSLSGSSLSKRPKFTPPTLYENARDRKSSRRKSATPKPTVYVRDIILLPKDSRGRDGVITIPRKERRSKLGVAGLVGKMEFNSNMSAQEVRSEICQVFATPMGLTESDIKNERLFSFTYLQTSSNALCIPSVSDSFKWNGRQVASLAKSASIIYLLANDVLPGCTNVSCQRL